MDECLALSSSSSDEKLAGRNREEAQNLLKLGIRPPQVFISPFLLRVGIRSFLLFLEEMHHLEQHGNMNFMKDMLAYTAKIYVDFDPNRGHFSFCFVTNSSLYRIVRNLFEFQCKRRLGNMRLFIAAGTSNLIPIVAYAKLNVSAERSMNVCSSSM
ncbi:hypothetical protein Cgig2_026585 [Carnegiea gigantea]|uniref:Uncharacterized protein n=1 Tax=Carnegiea gigantea TaxID=171969 RepID=A0A9Q1KKB2_9CARY|nr:hypothetical protein Cgig2_026585 [Carnegiea gigantea]